MERNRWKSLYEQLALDLELDTEMDIQSAEYLSMLTEDRELSPPEILEDIIRGKTVRVFGGGPTLLEDLKEGNFKDDVLIAADGATSAILEAELKPHIIVTDLDGNVEDQIKANADGSVVVIHAHGDNMDLLKELVPKFTGKMICTTQTDPREGVHNWGGFTDGDRAVYMADNFGAESITMVAFNFNEPARKKRRRPGDDTPVEEEPVVEEDEDTKRKLRKLTWANVLIGMLDHPDLKFYDME